MHCSSAASAKQHSPGWRRPRKRAPEPWGKMGGGQALKGRCRKPAPPLQGFFAHFHYPGLAPWAVLLRAISAPEELAQPLSIQLLQSAGTTVSHNETKPAFYAVLAQNELFGAVIIANDHATPQFYDTAGLDAGRGFEGGHDRRGDCSDFRRVAHDKDLRLRSASAEIFGDVLPRGHSGGQ